MDIGSAWGLIKRQNYQCFNGAPKQTGIAVINPIDLQLIYWFYARASSTGDQRYGSDPGKVEHGTYCSGNKPGRRVGQG